MNNEIESRRKVLHSALAVGCSLWAPVILSACDAKSTANDSAVAPAEVVGKELQVNVQYQTQPRGEHSCAGCTHFLAATNTCQLVEGQISHKGWCSLWAQKA